MDRYADGHDAAFDVVVDLLWPRLEAFFRRRLRDPDDAEDLVQKTLLRMHCARQHFVKGGDLTPWAYAIARNLWLDFDRQRRRQACVVSMEERSPAEEEDRGPSTEELLDGKRLGALMEGELAKLPDKYKEAFELVQLEGLSIREAAGTVGCTETAMKLRAHRSYAALRSALGDAAASRFGWRT
jgi:RNA polymerase sigma-70 factor (ECF subfamily)